jgi:hypothetical protein
MDIPLAGLSSPAADLKRYESVSFSPGGSMPDAGFIRAEIN